MFNDCNFIELKLLHHKNHYDDKNLFSIIRGLWIFCRLPSWAGQASAPGPGPAAWVWVAMRGVAAREQCSWVGGGPWQQKRRWGGFLQPVHHGHENPYTFLMTMKVGTVVLETSKNVSLKIKNRCHLWPIYLTPSHMFEWKEINMP